MLQQRQVGALFAVFGRTIGAVRFVRAVAPMAALVAVASIPLPRPAASIDVSAPPSGFVRTLAVVQRAVNGSADAVASNERRHDAMRGELRVRADVADSGASPVSRIGDRWLQLRAGQRAMQRSVDESPRHVGDRLLHPAAAPAPGDWFAASTFEAFALLGDAVKTAVDDPPAEAANEAANEAAPAAQPQPTSPIVIERNALAAAPRSAASLAPASMARAAAEARADARDTFSPLKLSPEQRNISRFVARRYRLNLDDVQRFVAHAFRAAGEFRLDPYLVLAVMSIESNFNPNARSSAGAQGLMQVLTRVHLDKFAPFGGARAALDPVANITVGSRILKEYLVREGSVEGALKSYVGAALLPHDCGYGNKVLTERARIAAAAREGATPPSTTASVAATQIAMAEPQLRAATAIAGDSPGASTSRQAYSALRAPALFEAKAREEL